MPVTGECCWGLEAARLGPGEARDEGGASKATNAIVELADQLRRERIEGVVVESTSAYWRLFVYLLQARGLTVWLVNARDVKQVPGSSEDRQAGRGLAREAERTRHASPLVRPAHGDPPLARLHPAAH
jgi:transposase